jgi:hypothetical protein
MTFLSPQFTNNRTYSSNTHSYHTIFTFRPSCCPYVLHLIQSHSRTFHTYCTCNCAFHIPTYLLTASVLFELQVSVNICTTCHHICIWHISCVSQHVALMSVQKDTFAISASHHPPCYSLRFIDQVVLSLRQRLYWDLSLALHDVLLYTVVDLYMPSIISFTSTYSVLRFTIL